MTAAPLKLVARDAQDLKLVAALAQDAIAPVSEMTFQAKEKNFVMVVHRFRWDTLEACLCAKDGAETCFERVQSAFDVGGVFSVKCAGFDPADPGLMLDLLTITIEESCLCLLFAGGMDIKLKVGADWSLRLEDFGEPWPTLRKPAHRT